MSGRLGEFAPAEFGQFLNGAAAAGAEAVFSQEPRDAAVQDSDDGCFGRAFVVGKEERSRRRAAAASTPTFPGGFDLVRHRGT